MRQERIERSNVRAVGHFCLYLVFMVGVWMTWTIVEAPAFVRWSTGTTILVALQSVALYYLTRAVVHNYRLAGSKDFPGVVGGHREIGNGKVWWAPIGGRKQPRNGGWSLLGWISLFIVPPAAFGIGIFLFRRRDARGPLLIGLSLLISVAIVVAASA